MLVTDTGLGNQVWSRTFPNLEEMACAKPKAIKVEAAKSTVSNTLACDVHYFALLQYSAMEFYAGWGGTGGRVNCCRGQRRVHNTATCSSPFKATPRIIISIAMMRAILIMLKDEDEEE